MYITDYGHFGAKFVAEVSVNQLTLKITCYYILVDVPTRRLLNPFLVINKLMDMLNILMCSSEQSQFPILQTCAVKPDIVKENNFIIKLFGKVSFLFIFFA